jgi:dTDP-4-dehydrorhamnose reductase
MGNNGASADAAIAVTGAAGMLGHDVVRELERRGVRYRAYDRAACDVASPESCEKLFAAEQFGAVVNCAAYTDVNRAESEEELATQINGIGAGNLAAACATAGARLIHVSTDYVFNGEKVGPYQVSDVTAPLNAYGRSKLAGEIAIARHLPEDQFCIARTSWLYGANGPNFVKTMLRLAGEGKVLKIINDQTGAPTYTVDLARALVDLALTPSACGIVHVTNSGECTWYEFARAIFEESGVTPGSILPCDTEDFPTPARRPANSRLSADRLLEFGISPLPAWRDGLRRYLQETGELARP